VSGCALACALEGQQQDPHSIGIISNDEPIARGAYDPSHGKAATLNISNGIITNKDLIAGTVSVYRISPQGISVDDLIPLLKGARKDANLFAISAASAAKIRAIKRDNGDRALCVLDECDCDQEGNKHTAHAHISLCRRYAANGVDQNDPEYAQIKRDLLDLFRPKTSIVWSEVKAKAA
jgi:hypothetical protein